ncbi:ribonuclease M5 [Tumebacillus permanentifrigoris]|uniref:Ribonuclease M5 n=1 Tax=Tumebacillus permanentifrigoris TaxID=378543 RepID=A0A316D746_9BACL|nr:ribonuclease M5 [Tumebacillus permanentifrigoris]PWK07927.1 ribonuclease M5 [Tumebacillus permanentifrigoris]
MKIKEVIVVEGYHDKQAIDAAVEADCLLSNGSAVSETFLKQVERAARERGVIVFTDPDGPGERIRRLVSRRVPGCKHAFLPKREATLNGDLGIENASPESIRRALESVRTEWSGQESEFSWQEMIEYGLTAHEFAAQRRMVLGEKLGIGYGNAKAMWKKLNMLGVSREEFEACFTEIKEESTS